MLFLVRIVLGLVVILALAVLIGYASNADVLAVIRQFIVWGWKTFMLWIAKIAPSIYKIMTVWFPKMVKEFIIRQLLSPIWKGLSIAFWPAFGIVCGLEMRDRVAESFERNKNKTIQTALLVWNFNPHWPRPVRWILALSIVAALVWLFLLIVEKYGTAYGVLFSFVAAFFIEKLPLIGLDQLITARFRHMRMHSEWYKEAVTEGRWRWIEWLRFRPLVQWLRLQGIIAERRWKRRWGDKTAVQVIRRVREKRRQRKLRRLERLEREIC